MTHKIFSASRNICFLYLVACLVAIGNLSFQQNIVYAYETSTTSSSTYHHHNTESNNVGSNLIPITASEKQPLPSLVMNASNDVNNNTNAKINNQNISGLSSSSPSLSAADAIQVNADFNNDGRDDLAIGAQDEDVGSIVDAGAVNVIYGSASGLSATAARPDQFWTQNTPDVEDDAEPLDRFGTALSTGDFNKDTFDDLAIGVNAEDVEVGNIANAGIVHVIYGSASGLSATAVKPDQKFQQGAGGLDDMPEQPDNFGFSLGAGDFNKDTFDDLAVGAPNEGITAGFEGIIQVIYGSSSGLSTSAVLADQKFQQGAGGLNGMPQLLDTFGFSLGAGDFNKDTFDDLALGVPGENIGSFTQAGIVQVIYGSSSGLSTSAVLPDQTFILADGASPGDPDQYGLTLSVGDFTQEGGDDLAVGAPTKQLGPSPEAGTVHVLYGSPSGLGNNFVFANHILAQGINGLDDIIEPGDEFAGTLSSADFNGDGSADLAVGVPGEDVSGISNAGAVNVIYGSHISGLVPIGDQFWTQKIHNEMQRDNAESGDGMGGIL